MVHWGSYSPKAGGQQGEEGKRFTLLILYTFCLLLILGRSCGNKVLKTLVVLDQLNAMDGEAV